MTNNEVELGDEFVNKLFDRVVYYAVGNNELIDKVAVKVLAGHRWAKDREFDPTFIQEHFDKDRNYAEDLLKNFQNSCKTFDKVIEEMINVQAAVIFLRRIKERQPQSPDDYENDKWEAKRYVAYLFFEDIRNNCMKDGICPDFSINLLHPEIVHLLKSLTVEDYCRIKGYLQYIERDEQHQHGFDLSDYLNSMGYLDQVFLNCKNQKLKKLNKQEGFSFDDKQVVKKAKLNTCYRLGCVAEENIEAFVNEYYAFLNQVVPDQREKKDAIKILKDLYNKSNSKIVNMMEFLLKCMVASYVDQREHADIRRAAGKEIEQVPKKNKRSQIKPFFDE